MHLVGRYEKVVLAGAHGIGPPMILDRGRAQEAARLLPFRHGEWISDGYMWRPAIRGGSGTWSYGTAPTILFGPGQAVGTLATLGLDSAYVYGSAGDAYGGHIGPLLAAKTVSVINVFVSSYTGAAANVNDLLIEARNNDAGFKPGSTLHDSQVHDPQSATGWRRQSGFTFTMLPSVQYWVSVSDPDGNGTDFATLMIRHSSGDFTGRNNSMTSIDTTDGYTTTTRVSPMAVLVIEFTDGTSWGNPITAAPGSTSGTYERGWVFHGGFPGTCLAVGVVAINSVSASTGVKLYDGVTLPGGTTIATGTQTIYQETGLIGGFLFDVPARLAANQTHRLAYDYSGANTIPGYAEIGAGSHDGLRRALWGHGNHVWTEESGGVWVDFADRQPRGMLLALSQFDAVEAAPPGTNVYPLRRMMS